MEHADKGHDCLPLQKFSDLASTVQHSFYLLELNMTPEQLASAQAKAQMIGQSDAMNRQAIVYGMHADAHSRLFAMLLDKWLERHLNNGKPPLPTPNDLRWLSRIAFRYAWYVPEAAGLVKVPDDHLDSLSGLMSNDMLSFDHLFSVRATKPNIENTNVASSDGVGTT